MNIKVSKYLLSTTKKTLAIACSKCLLITFEFSPTDGQLWKEVKAEVDYLLKPNFIEQAERHIRSANLSRIILIDDLQKVIDVENPPKDVIENLQNRKGKIAQKNL